MYGNPDAVFRPYHREHTILLSTERVNKGTKKTNSLTFSLSLRDFLGKPLLTNRT